MEANGFDQSVKTLATIGKWNWHSFNFWFELKIKILKWFNSRINRINYKNVNKSKYLELWIG